VRQTNRLNLVVVHARDSVHRLRHVVNLLSTSLLKTFRSSRSMTLLFSGPNYSKTEVQFARTDADTAKVAETCIIEIPAA
jgi:hypothetical protein